MCSLHNEEGSGGGNFRLCITCDGVKTIQCVWQAFVANLHSCLDWLLIYCAYLVREPCHPPRLVRPKLETQNEKRMPPGACQSLATCVRPHYLYVFVMWKRDL